MWIGNKRQYVRVNIKFLLLVVGLIVPFAIFDISNLDRQLYKVVCISLDSFFETNCSDYYDLQIWTVISSFGTIVALFAAWAAIDQSNKQLRIEQTPHVALDHIIRESDRYGFAIKNIGRGPAVHITFSTSDDISKRNNAFFSNDQPHSANFYPFEESHYWYVDGNVLDGLKHMDGFAYLYCFYSSQSNALFMTKVKIKRIVKKGNNDAYVVMENKFKAIEGGGI